MSLSDFPLPSECPICKEILMMDPGYPGSFEEPEDPPTVYCPYCEYTREPDDGDLKSLGQYYAGSEEFPGPFDYEELPDET